MALSTYIQSLYRAMPTAAHRYAIIAGGALRSFFDGSPVRDVDLWFSSEEDYNAACAAFWEAPGFTLTDRNCGSVTYSGNGFEWNLVFLAFGTPYEHLERFDFLCCAMAAWTDHYGTSHFHAEKGAIDDCYARKLTVRNNNGTERTMARIQKYVDKYGYSLDTVDIHECEDLVEDHPADPRSLAPLPAPDVLEYLRVRLRRCPAPANGGGST